MNKLFVPIATVICIVLFQNCAPSFTSNQALNSAAPAEFGVAPPNLSVALKCNSSLVGTGDAGTRRLTKEEIIATLTALFGSSIMSNSSVVSSLTVIPAQTVSSNANFNNSIVDVTGLETVAEKIADLVVADANTLRSILPNCSTSAVATCNTALVDTFAPKAYRRPLTTAQKTSLKSFSETIGGIDGVREALIRIITSPYFHQHFELGENGNDCGTNCVATNGVRMKLSPFEIASRISYRLTGGPPDDTLRAAALSNSLNSVAAIEAQAKRILSSSSARTNWRRTTKEWLGTSSSPDPVGVVAQEAGLTASGFGAEALEEMLRSSEYGVFDRNSDFAALMTDPVAFPYTDRLAKAYGVPKTNGAAAISADRGGLLLKPAVLLSGNSTSSPILRGVFVMRKIMCGTIPDPNFAELNERNNEVSFSHLDYSNRDYTAKLTSPNACIGCHSVINPIGFALENFGPTGVPRERESVFDNNGVIATHPIDTKVSNVLLGSTRVNLNGAADLVKFISKSEEARQCLSKAIIVSSRYRAKSDADNCLINELTSAQVDGASIQDVLVKSVANEEIFWTSAKELK